MPEIRVLPFDNKLGLPQRQAFEINRVAYKIYYRKNYQGDFVVLKIVRTEDDKIVFNSKICELNPYVVRDPTTRFFLFGLLPYKVDVENEELEIWVYW